MGPVGPAIANRLERDAGRSVDAAPDRPAKPFSLQAGMSPATVIGLQRHAGNTAVTRVLQRCGGGGCTCGGSCGASRSTLSPEDDLLLDADGLGRQFAGAVAARGV